jgi:hypothetical protein
MSRDIAACRPLEAICLLGGMCSVDGAVPIPLAGTHARAHTHTIWSVGVSCQYCDHMPWNWVTGGRQKEVPWSRISDRELNSGATILHPPPSSKTAGPSETATNGSRNLARNFSTKGQELLMITWKGTAKHHWSVALSHGGYLSLNGCKCIFICFSLHWSLLESDPRPCDCYASVSVLP